VESRSLSMTCHTPAEFKHAMAKGTGSKSKPSKGGSAKGSGAAPEQPDLFAEASAPPAKAPQEAPVESAPAKPGKAAKAEPAPAPAARVEQPAPVAAAAPPGPSAPSAPAVETPVVDAATVVELVNGVDGVWKKLSTGKRVDLTTKEWRHELSRLFTRAPAP